MTNPQPAHSLVTRLTTLMLAILVGPLAGCTYTGGELLFLMGVGRGAKIPAEFKLTDGPLLIFIDDLHERLDGPSGARHLFDDLSQELLRNKAAKRIVPLETLELLRQSVPEFEKKSCREIGEMAEAEQVLWIEVQDFLADHEVFEASNAAYFSVTAKVINPKEKTSRIMVRLWPPSPEGQSVSASLAGSEVSMAKTREGITKALSERLAERIAKLFYDHRAGEFDRPS